MTIFLTDTTLHKKVRLNCFDGSVYIKLLTLFQELHKVGFLNCDFTKFPIEDFERIENFKNGRVHYTARCICKAEMFGGILKIQIIWNDRQVCELEILDEERVGDRSSSASHIRSGSN
jgi:hypothetical protein